MTTSGIAHLTRAFLINVFDVVNDSFVCAFLWRRFIPSNCLVVMYGCDWLVLAALIRVFFVQHIRHRAQIVIVLFARLVVRNLTINTELIVRTRLDVLVVEYLLWFNICEKL